MSFRFQIVSYDEYGVFDVEKKCANEYTARLTAKSLSSKNKKIFSVENIFKPYEIILFKNGLKLKFVFNPFTFKY